MTSAEFAPEIQASEWPQTRALDSEANAIGSYSLMKFLLLLNIIFPSVIFLFSFNFCVCYFGCIAYLQKM